MTLIKVTFINLPPVGSRSEEGNQLSQKEESEPSSLQFGPERPGETYFAVEGDVEIYDKFRLISVQGVLVSQDLALLAFGESMLASLDLVGYLGGMVEEVRPYGTTTAAVEFVMPIHLNSEGLQPAARDPRATSTDGVASPFLHDELVGQSEAITSDYNVLLFDPNTPRHPGNKLTRVDKTPCLGPRVCP